MNEWMNAMDEEIDEWKDRWISSAILRVREMPRRAPDLLQMIEVSGQHLLGTQILSALRGLDIERELPVIGAAELWSRPKAGLDLHGRVIRTATKIPFDLIYVFCVFCVDRSSRARMRKMRGAQT